jgi:predicted metal-dependent hydrolase
MKVLEKWLNTSMDNLYLERYNYWYKMFEENIPYFKLKKRNMKTRWGVCNLKSNTITLNTNLIKYDIECLDYVIIHELSHLLEFNHSDNFWKIVSKYCKNYKKIKNKLKE